MPKLKPYDLIVIGGGSAGFNAARVAAGLSKRVAVVDGAKKLGGLCILRGCMPSKTLLYAAEVLHLSREGAKFGLRIPKARADMKAVQARKRRIIAEFADDRMRQLTAGKFKLVRSRARFVDSHTIELSDGTRLTGRKFLIGTGSKVSEPAIPGLADSGYWTSDDVLNLDFVPKSVLVLGGGIVACELAQFLRRIGSKVCMVQRSSRLLKEHSQESSAVIQEAFQKEGIELFTGTKIKKIIRRGKRVEVRFEHRGRTLTRSAEHVFNAMGREPDTSLLGLEAAGVGTGDRGRIKINRWQQTTRPHIYAAGDCSGPVEIVHVAIQQAELAARHAFHIKGLKPVDYSKLLSVVFTDPQVASIGRTRLQLTQGSIPFIEASYPFDDHGKSILMEAKLGYVKVFADPKRGKILGAEITGPSAGELIHCFTSPISAGATVFDMLKASWYHPTLAEILTYPLEALAESLSSPR